MVRIDAWLTSAMISIVQSKDRVSLTACRSACSVPVCPALGAPLRNSWHGCEVAAESTFHPEMHVTYVSQYVLEMRRRCCNLAAF